MAAPYQTLLDLVTARGLATPALPVYAFVTDDGTEQALTAGRLFMRARAIAARLATSTRPGDRVLVLHAPGLDFISSFFGALLAGLVPVPAPPPRARRDNERLHGIIASSGARLALIDPETGPIFGAVGLLEVCSAITPVEVPDAEAADHRPLDVRGDALAMIQYTSGSTSTPRGVALSHANLLSNLGFIEHCFRTHADSRGVIWLPPYHDMGLIGGLLQPLYVGFPVALMSPAVAFQHPLRWLELVSRTHATISGGPDFAYQAATRRITDAQRATLDLSSWEVAFNGAEPIRAETLEAFAAAFAPCGFRADALYPCYGLAEATLIATGGPPRRGARATAFDARALERGRAEPARGAGARRLVACGQAMPGQAVAIVDPERLVEREPGAIGEIWVRGPSIAQGYFDDPEATATTFGGRLADGAGPFLRTGDLGTIVDGELYVTGRRKDVLIQRGRKFHPHDLERTAARCLPSARDATAAAFAVELDGEEEVVLAIELAAAHEDAAAAALPAIGAAIWRDHELLVSEVVFVRRGSIPLTTSGKTRRAECRARFVRGELPILARGRIQVADLVEREWREVLASGATTGDFFAAGGQSLEALRLLGRLQSRFGVDVPLAGFLEAPTLAALADRIEAGLRTGRDATAPITPAPPAATHPLSYAQERLWVIALLEPGNPAYNVPVAFRARGRLELAALEAALGDLVVLHDALRTRLVVEGGRPAQEVLAHVELPLERLAIEGATTESRAQALGAVLTAEARRPFELTCAPLFRAGLVALAEDDHVLCFTAHHIVSDGWSLRALGEDLARAYAARVAGRAPAAPPPSVTYVDFALWQRRELADERLAGEVAAWGAELRALPTTLDLPRDRPRPPVFSFRGARRPLRIAGPLRAQIAAFARARGVTPYLVLLAAYEVLLARVSGEVQFLVGTPHAGRNRAELDATVGFFVNLLPLAADLAGEPTFDEVVARARAAVRTALGRHEVPFERLVQEVQPVRDVSRTPLVQVVFAYQAVPTAVPPLEGLVLEPVALDPGTSIFDLVLSLTDADERLDGYAEYNSDLFDARTVDRLLGGFVTVLDAATATPSSAVGRLPLISAAERTLVLDTWNQTAATLGEDVCLHALFRARVASQPGAIALTDGHTTTTYAELATRMDTVARDLAARGVGRGDRVALLLERSTDAVALMLGVLARGATYVPLDPRDPPARTTQILEGLPTRLVLGRAALIDRVPQRGAITSALSAWATDRDLVAVGPARAPHREARASDEPTGDDVAYVIFTSGSSGRPKGVQVRHRPAVNVIRWVNQALGVTPGDRLLFVTSLCFDLSVYDVFGALAAGATIRVASPEEGRDPAALARILTTEGITIWDSAPAALQQVLPFLPDASGERPGTLRRVMLSGDWIPLATPGRVRRAFPGCAVTALGGATEATIWSNWFEVDQVEPSWVSVPYGRPITNGRYYVLDAALEPTPIGVPGDLLIGGDVLADGYVGDPALTATRFIADPFAPTPGARMYRTGDRCRWLADGTLEFLGRLDDQVKLRGFRVELGEISAVLLEHPSVRDAVAVVVGTGGDRRLVAYVVAEQVDDEALRVWARARLPEHMVPSAFVAIERVPVTRSGKLDRAALPAPDWQVRGPRVAPRTERERELSRLWAEVLGSEPGIHDNFFDLGGNSLLLTRVYAALRAAGEEGVAMVSLFEHPTIAGLARHLDEASERPRPDTTSRAEQQREARRRAAARRGSAR